MFRVISSFGKQHLECETEEEALAFKAELEAAELIRRENAAIVAEAAAEYRLLHPNDLPVPTLYEVTFSVESD